MFNYVTNIVNNPERTYEVPHINTLSDLIGIGINVILGVGFAIGFVALALSLVKLITSRGDPKATGTAMNGITWSVIAIVLTIGAFAIKNVILNLLGVTETNLTHELPSL